MYQIAIPDNCNNPTYCGTDQLGGAWGWVALYVDGTGDGQLTFCGHGGGRGGAFHESIDIGKWSVVDGQLVFANVSNPSLDGPTPFPAAPGHYSNHPPPWVAKQITLSLNPTA